MDLFIALVPVTSTLRLLVALVGLLVVGLAVTAGYRLWPVFFPTVIDTAAGDPDCDLQLGPCTATFADGAAVTLSLAPRPIAVMQPLTLAVEIQGIDPGSVAVDFQGVEMNMGYNRSELKPESPARYTGEAMMPVCTRERMEWRVQVIVRTAEGYRAAPYRLVTWKR